MNSTYRKFSGWVGIVTMVFALLASSAYACPMLLANVGDRADAVNISSQTSDYADFVSPNLCHEHCADEQQNIKDAPQSLLVAVFGRGFSVTPVVTSATTNPNKKNTSEFLHGPAPPLTIQHCCFRI